MLRGVRQRGGGVGSSLVMFQNIGEMLILFVQALKSLPLAWRHRRKVFDQLF